MNKKQLFIWAVSALLSASINAKSSLQALKVEYAQTPLAVCVQHPRFTWQMVADDSQRGYRQTAYQITVTDEKGKEVWNTGKVNSDQSLNIEYGGEKLLPSARYQWNLKVWNQKNEELNESSFFETALVMAPDYNHTIPSMGKNGLNAWDGAKWIGKADHAVMFYAPYLPVFRLNYDLLLDKKSKSTAASLIFGANDPRLMDGNKNILGLQNEKDSAYIRVELDVAPLYKKQAAKLNVYRKGYKVNERDLQPIASYDIPNTLINDANKYETHQISISVDAGTTSFFIDNAPKAIGKLTLNPTGKQGGDYNAFPVIADLGYQLNPKQKATFSHIEVRNFRNPQNVIVDEKTSSLLDGGKLGYFRTFSLRENTAPMLRTVFSTSHKKIAKARLYATARGIYDLYINGKRVSTAYFNPGSTQYDRTQLYQTFDVTSLLNSGDNAIGAILSEGWWSGGATFVSSNWNFFGDRQSLLAKLQITYEDGTTQTITTNPKTWKAFDDGAVRYGSFFMGEVYDAQKEENIKGWATAAFDDKEWLPTAEIKNDDFTAASDFQLLPDMAGSIMPIDTLTAQGMEEVRKGVFVYDMGQNMAGVPLLHFKGLKPGTEVKIRTAEIKYPDLPQYKENVGMIMTENLRVATSQDIYIAKGGEETFSPRFTLHGFRYLEITGVESPVSQENVKAIALSSMQENSSLYSTSKPEVNRLWKNTIWSTRSNLMSVPTDCPQRNERLGWMGDISVFSRSATFITDASNFLRRYLISVRDDQGKDGRFPDVAPTGCGFGGLLWGSAGITVPWELYQQYGDKAMLREHYDAMKRYIEFVLKDYMDPKTGVLVQHHAWGDLGDWLSPVYNKDDKSLLWECYFIYDLDLMNRIAKELDKAEDANWFAELAAKRRSFFKVAYLDPKTKKTIFSDFEPKRKGQLVDTQASYVLPLVFHIVDDSTQQVLASHLAEAVKRSTDGYPSYSLLTGFIGTAWISKALSDNGMSDLAYRLLQQEEYPSWLYPVKNGATTVWERLNSYTIKDGFGKNNSMNSFNHYSFGAVVSWMYNYSLGIRRDETQPGFKHFYLQPEIDPTGGINHAAGYYNSMYGKIGSYWKHDPTSGVTEYNFSIPANTTATLILPASSKKLITESGKSLKKASGIQYLGVENGCQKMELQAGDYHFTVRTK